MFNLLRATIFYIRACSPYCYITQGIQLKIKPIHTTSLMAIHVCVCVYIYIYIYIYTGCNKRNGPDFGRVFLRSYYTDITQNTYVQSSMVTEILAREV